MQTLFCASGTCKRKDQHLGYSDATAGLEFTESELRKVRQYGSQQEEERENVLRRILHDDDDEQDEDEEVI
jgi:hypothetical protein